MKVLSLLLACGLIGPTQAQVSSPANKRVADYSVQADTFIDALLKIAARFELPLAVEWIKSADTLQPVRLSQKETIAAAVLDAVVSSRQGYAWQLESGVVHVFPRTLLTDSRNPLNMRITGFPKHPVTVAGANAFLFNASTETMRASQGKVESLPGGGVEPEFRIAVGDAPLREILNSVILASNTKVWIATFPSKLPLTLKGYFEVTPMMDPKYIHAEDQPVWIFLRWGDPPWKRLDTPTD